ncbi:Myocyte-specific enhancer factor 2A [Bagarius yarrelli]|uniref:Myocyte-specific enhancer factor 2A n=1 Tax=Bagarius yarrelli TaxID=175774 RepID=A0A556U0P5_BAGYA|nr:Myocyte-specific enhancer factor 2A [Bagarius yarrelli]
MGRKKIQITRIMDERNRQVTFTKRKFGLMKKAYELSVLCDCEIALIIFNSSNKLFQYASTDMDKVLLKYTEYNEPHESRTNSDIVEALNKKEQRGSESPEVDTCPYVLTPHAEEKYQKINEEFDSMMRNHKMPAVLSQQSFSMPVALPVSEHSVHSYSNIGALGEAGMMSPSSGPMQRSPNTRLTAGVHTSSDHTPNGVHCASVVNGYIGAQGESMGRGPTAKPAAPPTGNLTTIGHKPELRVLIPPSCKISPALRITSPSSSQSLSTQVVSMATPNMHPQGPVYPAMTSAYSSADSLASSCSSYEGSEREEQRRDSHPPVPTSGQGSGPSQGIRGPSLKRLRTESWVT